MIKMQLIKGQNSRDSFYKAVEEVAQDLDLRIKNIINSEQVDVAVNTTDISPARVMTFLFFIIFLYKTSSLLLLVEMLYHCHLSQESELLMLQDVENLSFSIGLCRIMLDLGKS